MICRHFGQHYKINQTMVHHQICHGSYVHNSYSIIIYRQQQWPIGGGDNLSGGGIQQQQSTDVGGGTNVQQWPSNKS